ncbi:transcription factor PHYTOCHROME INTERACTING FACTOR-LIKE 15-like isoform X2 [Castanea sativa]|uniref:transcription factor PHYTOCHROME INTERACTING FACTOR-LIKE 15-like isoform X2 n=1 Tax=Castanea sativa TaxID=21020 RepID=UPI003F65420A
MLEPTKPRMTSSLATLASTFEDDFVELVWENGEILMRDRSGKTQKGHSCVGDNLYPYNAQVENRANGHMKKARSGNGSSFSDFSGYKDGDLDFTNNNSSQNCYHLDSFSGLYNCNLVQNNSKSNDKHPKDSQVVLKHDTANFRHSNASKFVQRNSKLATSRSTHLHPSSLFCQESDSLITMGGLLTSTLPEHDSLPDKKTATVNISYLRPAALPTVNSQSSSVIRQASSLVLSRAEELKGSSEERPALFRSNPFESTVIELASGSKTGLQNQPDAELTAPISKTKESLPDEHSEAFGRRNHKSQDQLLGQASRLAANTPGEKPNIEKFIEPLVASSSIYSLGASNEPTYSLRRTYDDTEESAYRSENIEEPQTKQAPARGGTGTKRSRTAVHNFSERRRRDKINKKMRALKEIIPNCSKVDRVSILDEAIEYTKTLQLQLQIMSMGTVVYMPPMMSPMLMQRINAPHLTHFSPMGAGMGMTMSTGMGCSPTQVPTSQVGATALPGITGTGFQMLGIPGQPLPMSISHAPFFPLIGGPSTQSFPAFGISGAAPPVECTSLTSSKDSIQNINSELMNNANTGCSKIQTSSQLAATSVQKIIH